MAIQDVKVWLDESHHLAQTVAYDAEVIDFVRRFEQSCCRTVRPPLSLSEAYLKQGGAVTTIAAFAILSPVVGATANVSKLR